MPPGGGDLAKADVPIKFLQDIHHLPGLIGRIQPVRGERDKQKSGICHGQGFSGRTVGIAQVQIEIICGLCDIEKGVGVEALHELLSLVVQITFDLKFGFETEGEPPSMAQFSPELQMHGLVREIGDVPDHAGHGQAQVRPHSVIVVAVPPIGIAHDGLPGHLVEGDGLGGMTACRGQGQDSFHHVWIACGPLQNLHPAQGAADHGQQTFDAEMPKQLALGPDHVGDGHDGKIQAPVPAGGGVDGGWSARTHAAANDIGTDHEIAVRIDGFAWSHIVIPPSGLVIALMEPGHMGVAGQGVTDENRIGTFGVQLSIGFIGQGYGPQIHATVQNHGPRGMGKGERLGPDQANAGGGDHRVHVLS